jgi:hypothetical protein
MLRWPFGEQMWARLGVRDGQQLARNGLTMPESGIFLDFS